MNDKLQQIDITSFFSGLSWEKLGEQFVYQPNAPMLFSSGLFFFLFIGFLIIYKSLKKHLLARLVYVTLFSLYFYYKSSGIWFVLLLVTATSDFFIGRKLPQISSASRRKWMVVLSLCINLGMLAYFKYFNFLLSLGAQLGHELGTLLGNDTLQQITYEPLDIFLPVGISFFTFQSLSYVIDIYRRQLEPVHRWIDYVFYVSFFPQLVAGPIVRARDFLPQIYKEITVTRAQFGEGVFLILCGLFKKAVISDYISLNFVDRIFDAPLLYTGVENLLGVYGYALQIYCDFSGYSDMAIGIALLLGYRFNINFDSPYQSATITEFWRRWHISLSSWLKDYLYISLGGNRKGKVRTYINLIITMLLGGLWHGASLRFIFWGALHGVSLAIHKFVMGRFSSFKQLGTQMGSFRRVVGIFITFHLVCFGWIFFRAESMQTAGEVLTQIFTRFHPEVFLQFVMGYKGVFLLMLIGYILHFMPKKAEQAAQAVVTRSPLVVQSLMLVILIFIVIQVKSAGVQPFIYFQF
ncbi:alginate O-acetyltransferase complex protein AlgI [Parabacteroides sp. PF5-5]|uniref:MBOAT family O-acyltransferase n=1 Tax=unclassified Parabacteroides TaxID=2649774 RepID=UPI0024732D3F|nr:MULTISPECIES: MBOAT family protein [unclassified Parabacteroides]MDH6305830.1 alginate O-acetyltransferase complex protein AlgI [Parabacteroides sp. PH5-39]MDH6317356.1 alginate O-acetyltransferase complex protein AlgI [Parabacteroides sp. PF5-13]MDH6320564.1 alginate O-acetyltransferase complex protein AlgI [Parabacteroides sp. PH5-13]MDH6324273.1 alginate O-acetyltransferase complex protein AlgI [Parabacteroides sp. PH5-8]MDH6328470.1 alginate O-acetyltransferase complex protein AlgI [Par